MLSVSTSEENIVMPIEFTSFIAMPRTVMSSSGAMCEPLATHGIMSVMFQQDATRMNIKCSMIETGDGNWDTATIIFVGVSNQNQIHM